MLGRYIASVGRDPALAYDWLDLVLVGRSTNVGKSAALGLAPNATVISAHEHTADPDGWRSTRGWPSAIVVDIDTNAVPGPISDAWLLRNTLVAARVARGER